jgi:hypothetical protein
MVLSFSIFTRLLDRKTNSSGTVPSPYSLPPSGTKEADLATKLLLPYATLMAAIALVLLPHPTSPSSSTPSVQLTTSPGHAGQRTSPSSSPLALQRTSHTSCTLFVLHWPALNYTLPSQSRQSRPLRNRRLRDRLSRHLRALPGRGTMEHRRKRLGPPV